MAMADTIAKKYPSIDHIKVEELLKLNKDDLLIVDVRTAKEQKVSMIEGAIAASELEHHDLKEKHVIFYCTIGERSSRFAAKFAKKAAAKKVSNLHGSILSWIQSGQILTDSKNTPTKKVHVHNEAWSLVPKEYGAVWN